jgi:hypothetical protein
VTSEDHLIDIITPITKDRARTPLKPRKGEGSNRIHSKPSSFLGFSEVRARSLVIGVIMSIKSFSLVSLELPLPGF